MTTSGPPIELDPMDDANSRLLAAVRPAGWINPAPRPRYHLVVVGAGTGGLVTAAIAAGLGARVALVERHLMGGDCLNVGCVPSKAMLRAARGWHAARTAAERFGGPAVAGDGDFAAVMSRMRRLRADLSAADSAARYRDMGVDVFLGEGAFVARDAVEVAGARLRFRRAVIATGARAAVPAIHGLDGVPFLTNETVFNLTERPAHLIVLGGGPIGCELAQAFARLGTRVTLVQRDDRLLPHDDLEAAALVHSALLRDGVTLHLGHEATAVERSEAGLVVTVRRDGTDRRIEGDRLLVALGRTPNIERLGLDTACIASTRDGVTVNDRLQTSNHAVFAVGDVACRARFTHMADFEARLVVPNALFYGRSKVSSLIVPWATYTDPEVAHVGLDAEAVGRLGDRVQTVTLPLAEVDRAVLDGATDGFVRIHLAQGSDRILGATVVAEHAGELLGELALAMTAGAGLSTIGKTIHPYPTQAEAFRKAADRWRRGKLTPLVRRILALWFRFVN